MIMWELKWIIGTKEIYWHFTLSWGNSQSLEKGKLWDKNSVFLVKTVF